MVLDGKYDTRWTTADKFSKNTWKIWTLEYSVDSMETVGQTPKRQLWVRFPQGTLKDRKFVNKLTVFYMNIYFKINSFHLVEATKAI